VFLVCRADDTTDIVTGSPKRLRRVASLPATAVVEDAIVIDERLVAIEVVDGSHELVVRTLDGAELTRVVPEIPSSLRDVSAAATGHVTFTRQGFGEPSSFWDLDLADGVTTRIATSPTPFDAERMNVRRCFVDTDDGARIPLLLASIDDLDRKPVMLYTYGGFGVSLAPELRWAWIAWMELGGVLACAGVRGGGEYGPAWHRAGARRNKQRSIDDLLACARWLRARERRPTPLVAHGWSNGGLITAAAAMQDPALFAAVIVESAPLDMLRYESLGLGALWRSEYGSTADPQDCLALAQYSPVHNVPATACLPPILVTAADDDERVATEHAHAFIAALEERGQGGPFVLATTPNVDHAHRDIATLVTERTRALTFAAHFTGLSPVDAREETFHG
jgi:prolyl oligopeptidase